MTGGHEADKNGLLIESLIPWLKSKAWLEDVPSADLADVVAEAQAKALSVLRDMEGKRGRRLPDEELAPYIKTVMRNAIRDWKRDRPKTAELSSSERAGIDSGLFSIDRDEGDEGFSGLPTIRVPADSSATVRPRRPPLLTLVRYRFWWKPDAAAEYERAQRLLNDIPNENRREAVLLDLQGYRQGQIAIRLLVSQPYVSGVLREQYDAWGWDDKRVLVIRCVMAFANLIRLFGRVFPNTGFEFPLSRPLYFWEHNRPVFHLSRREFGEKEFGDEGFDPREDLIGMGERLAAERYRAHERSFELPREEKAYNRSRYSDFSLPVEDHTRDPWWKPGPQQGSKERRQRQERLNRLKAQEAMLYQAIMNDPALARWTKDLKLYHVGQLISWVVGDDGDYDYEDDDWLRL